MKNFWKNKKVLVTGGAGFIGSYVSKELIKRNSQVTIVVSPKTESEHLKRVFGSFLDKITVEKLDLLDFNNFLKATKNQEIVLNFAAMDGGTKFKLEHSAEIFRVNTQIVLNLFESCRINKVDRVLIMSSIDVYPQNAKSPVKEEYANLNNFEKEINGYAWSKRFSEIAAKLYYEQYGLKTAIARGGNVYGVDDYSGKDRGRIAPTFINKAIKGEDIAIWGNKNLKRSFLFISDLSNALLELTEKYAVCNPVNIVSENYTSLYELAKTIVGLTNNKSRIEITQSGGKKSAMNIYRGKINCQKAKKILHFKELVSLEDGLRKSIQFFKGGNL